MAAARRTAWAWVAVAMLRCPAAAEMRRRLCHAGGPDQLNCATCMSYCGVCDPSCFPAPTPRPTRHPTPRPTPRPSSLAPTATPAPTLEGCSLYIVGPEGASQGNVVAYGNSYPNYELSFVMELASDSDEYIVQEFVLGSGSRTRQDARSYCLANGMDLASIHSEAENQLAWDLCSSSGGNRCWIGGEYTGGTSWAWSDGSAWDFNKWLAPCGDGACS